MRFYVTYWAVWVIAILLGKALFAQENNIENDKYQSLLENSPFVPFGYTSKAPASKPAAAKTSGKLELRGMVELDGLWQFSFYDTQKKQGLWVSQNDSTASIKIVDFSAKDQTVTIDSGSGAQTLSLKSPSLGTALPAPRGSSASGSSSSGSERKRSSYDDGFGPPSPRSGGKSSSPSEDDLAALIKELEALDAEFGGK